MSKVDAQRAMREARWAALQSNKKAAPAPEREQSPAVSGLSPKTVLDPAPELAVCGHRSMNGRSCSRPAGHTEKNHRYS